jgi:hypothetical protein
MVKARPDEWAGLREFDSRWLMKADDMADAAFIYGFLCARRMTRVCLSESSGTAKDKETAGEG